VSPIVTIKVSEEEYRDLKKRAEELGFSTLSEYILSMLKEGRPHVPLEAKPSEPKPSPEQSKVIMAVERKVQDIVNPYTAKIEELSRRISIVIEKLEELHDAIEELRKAKVRLESLRRAETRPKRRRSKMTAIEHLREEGVVFQSELTWLNNPRAFFEKLRREGAIVIKAGEEYVAVDTSYWEEFKKILAKEKADDPEKVKAKMSERMSKLFARLLSEGVVFYDPTSKEWTVASEE